MGQRIYALVSSTAHWNTSFNFGEELELAVRASEILYSVKVKK